MFWKCLLGFSLSALIAAGFWSTPIPHTEPPMDKVAHLLGFTFLSLCMFYAVRIWNLWISALLLVMLGLFIELGQKWFLPLRTYSIEDIAANTLGVLVALVIYKAHHYIKR